MKSSDYTQAYELGYALGREGHTVTGGYFGVMQAAAQGALDAAVRPSVSPARILLTTYGAKPFIQDHRSTPSLNARLEVSSARRVLSPFPADWHNGRDSWP